MIEVYCAKCSARFTIVADLNQLSKKEVCPSCRKAYKIEDLKKVPFQKRWVTKEV